MTITTDTIITAAAVLTAITALGTAIYKGVKWLQEQKKQTEEIKAIKEEQCMMSYVMFACLDGLKQLGCNGEVSKAHDKLQKHLNQKAHDQIKEP